MQQQNRSSIRHPEITDSDLVQKALTGDQLAFETLVHRYETTLFHLIYHHVQEYQSTMDVLQHVLLQFYLSLATLRSRDHLRPWLFMVARNSCVDFLRRKRPIYFSELEIDTHAPNGSSVLEVLPDTNPQPEELLEIQELQQCVQRAITTLPALYRPVVWHHCIEHLSFPEIGRMLNISTSAAKTHFHRAKPLLRAAIVAQEEKNLS